jgi:hypothetical protein
MDIQDIYTYKPTKVCYESCSESVWSQKATLSQIRLVIAGISFDGRAIDSPFLLYD